MLPANRNRNNVLNLRRCLPSILINVDDMFFDGDSDADNEETAIQEDRWFLQSIECMNTMQFQRHFRLQPHSFEHLLGKLHGLYVPSKIGHPEIPLELSLLICIWYLANIESFRGVAARFQVSKSTAWKAFLRISECIVIMSRRYHIISWPRRGRLERIRTSFYDKSFIPGILGVIDGCHIKIIAPKNQPNSYINRKGYHSVILQGVCDDKKIFTDVHIGEVGSVHDYTVYLKSTLSRRPDEDFPEDSHLIGDLAYKLSMHLLVGFKDNGHLLEIQKHFNTILSKARVIIENAFALLKVRFRRLKLIEAIIPKHVCLIVLVSCILHNVCLMRGDYLEDIADIEQEINGERINNPDNLLDIDVNLFQNRLIDRQAVVKRNDIMNGILLH